MGGGSLGGIRGDERNLKTLGKVFEDGKINDGSVGEKK